MMTLPTRQPIRVSEQKCAVCIEKEAREKLGLSSPIRENSGGFIGMKKVDTWELLKEGLSPVSSPR